MSRDGRRAKSDGSAHNSAHVALIKNQRESLGEQGEGIRRPSRDLGWIDGFYRDIKDHLFLREEDNVLILPPNRVYKLNAAAAAILKHLSSGAGIHSFPGIMPGQRTSEVQDFFTALKSFYQGAEGKGYSANAVSQVAYDFRFTRLPVLGEIAVTYRCNNRCQFCYASCGESPGISGERRRELSTVQLRRIIRIFKEKAKIPFFSFTGGEPLLRRDLEKLISYAVGTGLKVNLVSNGTFVDRGRARSLYRSGLRTAQISIEANGPEIHDELTGVPGSFSRTLSGIEALQDSGIRVQTNTTISRVNAHLAAKMPRFLRERGVSRFAMNLYIPSGRGLSHARLFLPYSAIPPIIEEVRREARRLGMVFYWYSPVPLCHYNPIARGLGNKACAAMDGLLSVSPSGDVLPCSSYPEPIGNILRQDFADIWFSRRAAYFKNKRYAPQECNGCDKFVACQAACPLYWRYAGTEEIRNPEAQAGRQERA
jgi:radical SAM protein with 4Fe4S-binding SPASM domain